MAKKTLRIASVDEKVTSLIDRGREVDEQIKNLTVEDKGIKVIVGKAGMESLQLGET